MGDSEGRDERFFATVKCVREHGEPLWWLYASQCVSCGQGWLVAQEERIFDEFFLRCLTADELAEIERGIWPGGFLTYESVLRTGHSLSRPCVFLNPLASSLVWSVEDLARDRPDISADEIASLLGVSDRNAQRLLRKANLG